MTAFEEPKPALSPAELEALAGQLYGIGGRATVLASERDLNARIDTRAGRFVLKVVNPAEDPAPLALQEAALAHLAALDFAGVPHTVPTLSGAARGSVAVKGRVCAVRMARWLDGPLLSGVPRSAAQLGDLGRFMGRFTRAMQGFGHPAAFRDGFVWSLDQVAGLEAHVDGIRDPARRALVARLFGRYGATVAPRLAGLRASVLHQDANDNNVVVDPSDPDRIAGLIDFGDMCFGRTINELAITLAYALLEAPEPCVAMHRLIAGYATEFPLTGDEAETVFDLMRMRLVASVCISSRQAQIHPENAYLLVSQEPAFTLLERLEAFDPAFMAALCRHAAGHPAIPRLAAVRAHLAAVVPHPVLAPDPGRAGRILLAENAAPRGMPAFSDPAFEAWFAARRPDDLPDFAGFYGIIPDGANRAITLLAAEGTPVLAPFDGVVQATGGAGAALILHHARPEGADFLTLYRGASAAPLVPGDRVAAGDVIGMLAGRSKNGGVAPYLRLQVLAANISEKCNKIVDPDEELREFWSEMCIDPNLILRLAPETFRPDPAPPEVLLARRARTLGPSLSIAYRRKLKIVSGAGAWLTDHTGRRYLDAVNNIAHVGHSHPHVTEALARQVARLNTNTRYLHEAILDYADRLTAMLPAPLQVAYFVNSGTEANELALRIARTALGRKETLVLDWAYHGNSGGMVEISPYKFKRKGGFPQPTFVRIAPFPDPFRGLHRGADAASAYAAEVGRCLDDLARETGDGRAAFIAESASGVGGQVLYPPGYLRAAYAEVRARGGICIADEVQCGFGRVGSHFWAFEMQDAVPDIVVMGKPMGNGHPLAAVVTTPELAARFANGMEYFNSFGGNPVSMAVGHAVLDVIEAEDLQACARATGAALLARLRALQARFPVIGDVRSAGLFAGVELVREGLAPAAAEAAFIVNRMARAGVLISTDGPDDNVLKIKPPMVFGAPEAEVLAGALEEALDALARRG